MTATTSPEGEKTSLSAQKKKPSANLRRSMARLAAVQALFQALFNQKSAVLLAKEFLDDRLEEEQDGLSLKEMDQAFFQELVKGNEGEEEALNDMVSSLLDQDWTLDRLNPLLRVIMKAGAYEIQARRDVPVKVLIAEYVDIAHAYFGAKETAMANGLLDKLAHSLRAEEFKVQ